ncbi:MAG: type II secretion system protein [Candidatus Zixiibacteriota bacterium]
MCWSIRRLRKSKFSQRGFTIVELSIIFVILGLLTSVTTPLYQGLQTEAKKERAANRTIFT